MNRIVIENDIVTKQVVDSKIRVTFLDKNEQFTVNKLVIDFLEDTTLELSYHNETAFKLDILIRVREGVKADIFEIRSGNAMKIQYRYELDTKSELTIQKLYHTLGMKELDSIYLNGEFSKIEYTLKTVCTSREKYNITVYHQAKNTESFVRTGGVNIQDGTIDFHVSGIVPNGKTESIVNQNNQIINFTEQKCSIYPNLFIDEYDVSANHSAWIGKFNEEQLFYLQSRGLSEEDANRLLVKGFLLSNLKQTKEQKEKIEDIINQYWR